MSLLSKSTFTSQTLNSIADGTRKMTPDEIASWIEARKQTEAWSTFVADPQVAVNDIQGTLTSSVSAMLIGEDNMIELQAKVNTEREKDYKEYQNQTEELIKENTRLNEKIKALEEENAALKAATGTS